MSGSSSSMSKILQFLRSDHPFDPEALRALGKGYEMALAVLHDVGQPDVVREVIAKRIVTAAQKGERDPAKLCATALSAFDSDKLIR